MIRKDWRQNYSNLIKRYLQLTKDWLYSVQWIQNQYINTCRYQTIYCVVYSKLTLCNCSFLIQHFRSLLVCAVFLLRLGGEGEKKSKRYLSAVTHTLSEWGSSLTVLIFKISVYECHTFLWAVPFSSGQEIFLHVLSCLLILQLTWSSACSSLIFRPYTKSIPDSKSVLMCVH